MLVDAVKLNTANMAGQDVPVFVWLMFARDTSETVDKFVTNHLNCVGDSGGLEQVRMFTELSDKGGGREGKYNSLVKCLTGIWKWF